MALLYTAFHNSATVSIKLRNVADSFLAYSNKKWPVESNKATKSGVKNISNIYRLYINS